MRLLYTRYTGGDKPPFPIPRETFEPQGGVTVSWELDLWGRLRRATESARAELLATEEVRRGVVTTLIAQVAQAYFDLRALDAVLEISRGTLARGSSLDSCRRGTSMVSDGRPPGGSVLRVARTVPDVGGA
jgi:outer membrane protein TolC